MKIMVFLHGTATKPAKWDLTGQSFSHYVPTGKAVEKLKNWVSQGAQICYLTSHEHATGVEIDKQVLANYDFPQGEIYWRQNGAVYKDVVERVMPDILIEDDCESIGGEAEMTYPYIRPDLKPKIKSIVV
ncbi:hypothetical protein KKH13_02550, partial [Patescibacteria group bacterium]|nr:hypothetical protein [Patescibacteria group bacterium]